MALNIVWTPTADAKLYETVAFIADNWPEAVVNEFLDSVFKAVKLISDFPEIGQKTATKPDLRSYFVRPYTRVIYRIKSDKVVILRLLDTRQQNS